MSKGKTVQRNEIEEKYKWNLKDVYPEVSKWKEDYEKIKDKMSKIEDFKGTLGESSENLLKCLQFRDEVSSLAEKLFSYATRKKDEDTRISENQKLYSQARNLLIELQSITSFIVPEILEIPEEKLNKFLEENEDLKLYEHHLDDITRVRDHVLTPEMEKVMAMASDVTGAPGQIYQMINNADIEYPSIEDEDGEEVQLTKGRYLKFMQSKDRRVREDAFKAFYSSYKDMKNTMATTLSSNIKADIFSAKVRKYDSTLEAALDGSNIPVSVYDNLINAVSDNLEPMYKYTRLRKKLLGVDELHMYDLYVSMIKDVDIEIPYEEAKETIIEALAPLGEEYQEMIKKGFESRWVDVYENEGKTSGAYSAGVYGVHPYVLMNYNDTLSSMFTLAHEMGHALHNYLSDATQPYVYHRYTLFLAEVASTVNEVLLMKHLLKTTEEKEVKMAILNHFLEQFRGTLYRQTMFAEFESLIHKKAEEGEILTHELLSDEYTKLNEKYYGPDTVIDEDVEIEWARIPHFYYNFYVYKYATGFSSAISIANSILEEGQPAVERYMEFLRSGGSDYSINILKEAGVDMTTPEPVVQALQTFKDAVDEMEELTE